MQITIIIDDAGNGDLLLGIVIGVYQSDNDYFRYDVIDVKFFQPPLFKQKLYLQQAAKIIFSLLEKFHLQPGESIEICNSYLFDLAVNDLVKKYGEGRIKRIKVTGDPQYLTETAYLDEIRNLGYKPLDKRETKRAKSFFHMMNWLKHNPDKMKYAKTGWPRLSRYRLFKTVN
jgi:hypothetical protein